MTEPSTPGVRLASAARAEAESAEQEGGAVELRAEEVKVEIPTPPPCAERIEAAVPSPESVAPTTWPPSTAPGLTMDRRADLELC
jgi:hypothetical protein